MNEMRSFSSTEDLEEENQKFLKEFEGYTDGSYGFAQAIVHSRRELLKIGVPSDVVARITGEQLLATSRVLKVLEADKVRDSVLAGDWEYVFSVEKKLLTNPDLFKVEALPQAYLDFLSEFSDEEKVAFWRGGVAEVCPANACAIVANQDLRKLLPDPFYLGISSVFLSALNRKLRKITSAGNSAIFVDESIMKRLDAQKMWWILFSVGTRYVLLPVYEFLSSGYFPRILSMPTDVQVSSDDYLIIVALNRDTMGTPDYDMRYLNFAAECSKRFSDRSFPVEYVLRKLGFSEPEKVYPRFPDLLLAIYKEVRFS